MGLTYAKLKVKQHHKKKEFVTVEFLIDSGAVYTLIPEKYLKKIGVKPYKREEFILADGTVIMRNVGNAYFEWKNEKGTAPVIFGEEGDQPLLGAMTLESLGLVLNPFNREVKPMKLMLADAVKKIV